MQNTEIIDWSIIIRTLKLQKITEFLKGPMFINKVLIRKRYENPEVASLGDQLGSPIT